MHIFLRWYEAPTKNVTHKYNAQPQLVCPNSSHYLNRHLSAQFGDLVNPHLKITTGRLANFLKFPQSFKGNTPCTKNSFRNPYGQNM